MSEQYGDPIHFINTGTRACTMRGYPGLAVLNAAGRQVYQAVRRPSGFVGGMTKTGVPPLITLNPGAEATATLQGALVGPTGANCPAYQTVLITPPNSTASASVRLVHPVSTCQAPEITPSLPGSTGRD